MILRSAEASRDAGWPWVSLCQWLRVVSVADLVESRETLVGFRRALYRCFGRRADALFELVDVDAVLTADSPVSSLVELCLEKAFRRGHGALYDALACGEVDVAALTALIAGTWQPVDDGPLKIAVDVSAWRNLSRSVRPAVVKQRGSRPRRGR